MKNSNRKFFRNEWSIFENLSTKQVQQLCFADIAFTELTGFLFVAREKGRDMQQKISKHLLLRSMQESLMLSQN